MSANGRLTKNAALNSLMVRPEVIRRWLQKIDEYLESLEQAQAYTYEEFASDVEARSAVGVQA